MGTAIKTLQYHYDSRGNRSALIDHDGGRFTYAYDAVNRISQVLNPQGNRTTYSYDSAGRRTLKQLSNGTRASFTYDAAGNLTRLYNLKSTGAVVSSFDYTYDKVGNRMAVLEAGGSRVSWSYDNGYQLTGEHRTGANAYRDTFTYDPAGNRLLKNHDGARTTYAYDAANQLSYSQDVSGRTTFTFDADGNQQVVREPSGNRTTYAWDYENRMTSARLPSGIRNTMAYDADGLRVKLEESTGTKKLVWDDQNYLGETDAANDTQVIYTNEPRLYGSLASQRRGSTSHWYHFDALGSTRQLTDNSAVVTDTRLYDAWGNPIVATGSTVSSLRWVGGVGYYFDAQTGLYYVRARVYQPTVGRWMSVDPIGTFISSLSGREVNYYLHVLNRMLTMIDASGLEQTVTTEDCETVAQRCLEDCRLRYFWAWTKAKCYIGCLEKQKACESKRIEKMRACCEDDSVCLETLDQIDHLIKDTSILFCAINPCERWVDKAKDAFDDKFNCMSWPCKLDGGIVVDDDTAGVNPPGGVLGTITNHNYLVIRIKDCTYYADVGLCGKDAGSLNRTSTAPE